MKHRVGRKLWPMAATIAVMVGCSGGGHKQQTTTNGQTTTEDPDRKDVISGEELNDLKRFFDRKRRFVAKCYGEALETGEVTGNKAYVTVWLQIQPDGSGKNVRVEEASVESKTLHECVLGYVRRWSFIKLPKVLDYTYTFSFERL